MDRTRACNIKNSADNDKQYGAITEILTKHSDNDTITSLIMTYISSKQIHLFTKLNDDNTVIEFFAVNTFSDQILCTFRSGLPPSFTNREETGEYSYDIKIHNNNTVWIHFTEECDESMKHYIMKCQLLGSPLKCVNWTVYESETPAEDESVDDFDQMKDVLDGNNSASFGLFTKNDYLRFTENYVHKFNTLTQETEVICDCNHPYFEIFRSGDFDFNPLESMIQSHSYDDIQFLYGDDDEGRRDSLVISILYNETPDYRLDLIEIYDDEANQSSKSRIKSINLEAFLMAIYGLRKVMIHGYFIDERNQNLILIADSCDVLILDKNLQLIRREKLGFDVHKHYVCKMQRALNGNDWLFTVNHLCGYDEDECEEVVEVLFVDGTTFHKIKKSELLTWNWNAIDRVSCDFSRSANVNPFIYST